MYFATSFKFKDEYLNIYQKLKVYLDEKYGIELYSFVFEYKGDVEDHKMMKADFIEMDKSGLIIAEASHKSIGVGVEVGYFKAQHKNVIYLHKQNTEIENIINGVSDYVIDYSDVDDIINWFDKNCDKLN